HSFPGARAFPHHAGDRSRTDRSEWLRSIPRRCGGEVSREHGPATVAGKCGRGGPRHGKESSGGTGIDLHGITRWHGGGELKMSKWKSCAAGNSSVSPLRTRRLWALSA